MTMKIGSLFSGVGGLELGLERAGIGETVWQVERDAYCRAVLARRWPDVERYRNVKTVGKKNLARVDLICGGFPCQDISSVGKRAGLAGSKSGLWVEFRRIVQELRPSWVVVENVASGARKWVDAVCRALARDGYACLPIPIAARYVGAKHRRARVFIIAAHANSSIVRFEQGGGGGSRWKDSLVASGDCWRAAEPKMVRVVHGLSGRLDKPSSRRKALGNAVVPKCGEVVGHVIKRLCS